MLWTPGADAPRNIEGLAAYIDQRFGELSRALDTFKIFAEVYTPVWTHSVSTAPSLGNGVLLGQAVRFGSVAFIQIFLRIGSTTTFEAVATPGQWRFSVPYAAQGQLAIYIGVGKVRNAGVELYTSMVEIINEDSFVTAKLEQNAGAAVVKSVPFTWATGDELAFSIMYPVRD